MDPRIESSILFIAKNFRSKLLLEDLAAESGISKFHFHRLFKAETGLTPLNYINKLKLEYAVHFLIAYPSNKQLEIALDSGYSSPAVFARTFKQHFHNSPMVYRKEKLGTEQILEQISKGYSHLDVTYLKQKRIFVSRSNLLKNNLSNLYGKLIKKTNKTSFIIGFYIDSPLHKGLDECRYYAGMEDEQFSTPYVETNSSNQTHFDIEEGFYTHFDIQGDFEHVKQLIIDYYNKVIVPSSYQLSSFISFEKIKLPARNSNFDYFSAIRTLYLKIKQK